MLTLSPAVRIYLASGATDLRRSIDGLSAVVRERFGLDPLSGHLFRFRNRRGDRLKILVWDQSGFWILYKWLELGTLHGPRKPTRGPSKCAAGICCCYSRAWTWNARVAAAGTSAWPDASLIVSSCKHSAHRERMVGQWILRVLSTQRSRTCRPRAPSLRRCRSNSPRPARDRVVAPSAGRAGSAPLWQEVGKGRSPSAAARVSATVE